MSRTIAELEELAQNVPSMSGHAIQREMAAQVPEETSIVEVGAWLGGGTAQLALGVLDSGRDIKIHCFDQWTATKSEVAKAERKANIKVSRGDDLLPIFKEYMKPFPVRMKCHQGDIMDAKWKAGPISLYIDDAAKREKYFRQMLRTFGPSWIPGGTILLLMDYHLWTKLEPDEDLKFQKYFMEAHPKQFKPLKTRVPGTTIAVFRYMGGLDFKSI